MPQSYAKPALTYEAQLNRLHERGMDIGNRYEAEENLRRIGYYRLSGYWLAFKRADDTYEPGATFAKAVELYEFDRELRLLMLNGIERIEIEVRTAIAYELGHAFTPFGHEIEANFLERFGAPPPQNGAPQYSHAEWLRDLNNETERARELFIEHFKTKYTGFPRVPIWMATEIMSLGTLSKLYRGMKPSNRTPVASRFDVHHTVLQSWLHTLSYVRNICAHHGRLMNRKLAITPAIPRGDSDWTSDKFTSQSHVYVPLMIIRKMISAHHLARDWRDETVRLLHTWDGQVRWQRAMGMPDNWASQSLWG